MEEVLRFIKDYEVWIYVLLAFGGLIYIRKFMKAWEELRAAAFGLERESAQSHLNHSASMLAFLLFLGIGVFALGTFIVPSVPSANPLFTPTLDLLATPTTTLAAGANEGGSLASFTSTPSPPPTVLPAGEGCTPGQAVLTEPQDGAEVSGTVTLKGTANIPNFGFYKYEIARPGDAIWLTIQAGRNVVLDGELGQWNTQTLSSGEYLLRLVVTDNQGNSLPPCVIKVYVNNPAQP